MNKRGIVNIEARLQAEALRVLRGIPGLTVTAQRGAADRRTDAIIHFADNRATVLVEFKRNANPAAAWQLVHHAQAQPDTPILLIAGETTAETRKILEEHGISVIDGLGNAHIELPGLLFHLEGRARAERRAATPQAPRLKGKAGVVAQALLLNTEREWQVKDLAGEAGVSPALAHRVLARLQQEGLVAAKGAGPNRVRRVTDPTALLDLWAEENVDRRTRTLGFVLAQTPQALLKEIGTNLERGGIDYALTGAAGARLVAPLLTAVPVVEVWVPAAASPQDLYQGARAEPVNDGQNLIFLQEKNDTPLAFREKANGLWLANRFRLYADLLRDPRRGREQADNLRREVIGF